MDRRVQLYAPNSSKKRNCCARDSCTRYRELSGKNKKSRISKLDRSYMKTPFSKILCRAMAR